MRVGDLPMADRFAYAFRKWRFGASDTVKEGEFCMARACVLPALASAARSAGNSGAKSG